MYLEDFWRTDLPRIQKEGNVYRELPDANVPNIPALGPSGDVPSSPDHGDKFPLVVQRTKTQDYVKRSARYEVLLTRGERCPGRQCVTPYVHYRLVLETLGQPLDTFKSTRQLCEVIRDAIFGKEYRSLWRSYWLRIRDSSHCGVRQNSNITSGYQRGKHSDYR